MAEREGLVLSLRGGWTLQAAGIRRDRNGDVSADLILQNGTLDHASRGVLNTPLGRRTWANDAAGPERPSAAELERGLLALLPEALAQLQEGDAKAPTQADALVKLALSSTELFHVPRGNAYAMISVGDHRETWPIRSKGFRLYLQRRYYEQFEKSPGGQAVQDALGVLEGKALFDNPEQDVFIRVAQRGDALYLDLANDRWEAVEITAQGWQVVDDPPVRFRRPKGMLPLPQPVRGGTLESLRQFVNVVGDRDWYLLIAWLAAAVRPAGPYPILALHGEQGSGKSSAARLLRRIIDPNASELRAEPRTVHDLMIAASNSLVVCYDNLSRLPEWLSDALCRVSTGGGFATRELYSNDEETIFEAQRPIILNGIEELATRADLLDRAIIVDLPTIPERRRRPEAAFWEAFAREHPRLLGALLDALSGALERYPSIRLDKLPRMADFALWATSVEATLGWEAGAFMTAYTANRQAANRVAIDAWPIAEKVSALVANVRTWEGTATELLLALNGRIDDEKRKALEHDKLWPKNASGLSNMLRRLAPNLRAEGVNIAFDRVGHQNRRMIWLEQSCETSPQASAPSAGNDDPLPVALLDDQRAGGMNDARTLQVEGLPADRATQNAPTQGRWRGADGADTADGKIRDDSQAFQHLESDYCRACGRVLPNAAARVLGLCAACEQERVT